MRGGYSPYIQRFSSYFLNYAKYLPVKCFVKDEISFAIRVHPPRAKFKVFRLHAIRTKTTYITEHKYPEL